MLTKKRATIEDLYRVDGKAELVDGEILQFMPTGRQPMYAAGEIFIALHQLARRRTNACAVTDNAAFLVSLPHRKSLSPDAAYYVGPDSGMRFFQGAPVFAVEVRSEGDYGPAAEEGIAAKRADYFAAGTQVVWDVDLLDDLVVHKYTSAEPDHPVGFRRGEIADAEPALPGWRMPVDDLFE